MKFVICFAALVSVLGWQVTCDVGQDFLKNHIDFQAWLRTVTTWEGFENSFFEAMPVTMWDLMCMDDPSNIELILQQHQMMNKCVFSPETFSLSLSGKHGGETREKMAEELMKHMEACLMENFADRFKAPIEIPIGTNQSQINKSGSK